MDEELSSSKDDEIFGLAMSCKCECNLYKKLYGDLWDSHNKLLDKYEELEELYKQKGE